MIVVGDRAVDLTVIEYKLLTLVTAKRGHGHSRSDLLSRVWGFDRDIKTRTVDTHVRRLREKLGPAASQNRTVRGFGYRIDEGHGACRRHWSVASGREFRALLHFERFPALANKHRAGIIAPLYASYPAP